jgi:NDP-hexose-3-ketoreductase
VRLLLIGYSKIAQKRVLPALAEAGVTRVDVASHSRAGDVVLPQEATGQVFGNYEAALDESDADLVYVSTVNSAHAEWIEKALERGYHVVVDKPACTSLMETQRLLDLARRKGRCLAEATVYGYHPQIGAARQAFVEAGSRPTRIVATFSFPPLPADNFRYRATSDGGALWDLGPYAVTPGRLFFGQEPKEVACHVTGQGDEVETSFSVLMTYRDGCSMVGHFGFETGYRNRLDILGPDVTVTIDRVFTTPADMASELHINQRNQARVVEVPPADSFALFLRAVIDGIEAGQHKSLADDLLADARVLWRLRKAGEMNSEPMTNGQ